MTTIIDYVRSATTPLRSDLSPADLSIRQVRECELELDQPAVVEVDGDAIGRSAKVAVRIDQGALLIAG